MCESTELILTKFHQRNYWANNKFFKQGCFKANNCYEGDDCCDNQNPEPCNIFTNVETPWMKNNNQECSISNLLPKKCKFSTTWANGKFCQQSCFEEVNFYDNNNCCESEKNPTETPTNHPTSFPSHNPIPLLG